MVRCRKTNFGILVGNPPAIGWYQPANFPASLLPVGVTPTTSRRIATRSLRRKMARSQAEQVASVHAFSSQERAETIPRDGVVFLWGAYWPLNPSSQHSDCAFTGHRK